jgi:hypothetical protein
MTRSEVLEELGYMYDNSKRGEYRDVDAVLTTMENPESITEVCNWRVARSRDNFWVGFDENDVVVSVRLD